MQTPCTLIKISTGTTSTQDLDGEVARALACPCVADLRDGPCGASFVQAFTCFLKVKGEDKGTVCYEPYQDMQACMMKHPESFADFVKDKTESELEQDAETAARNGTQSS